MKRLLVTLAAFAWIATAHAQVPSADFILLNGKIVTVDPLFDIVQAVAVKGERVVAIGPTAQIRAMAAAGARVIDLQGRTVIPGLIDNHGHYARAAQTWLREARLDGVLSRSDAMEKLRARAKTVKPDDWVVVIGGWSEGQFADEPRGFTREELDRLVPDHPVYLQVNYSHAYVNSAALAAAGIDEHTAEPRGGKIERDANGRLTGRLDGAGAYMPVFRQIPPPPPEQAIAGATALLGDLSRVGVTAIGDVGGYNFSPDFYKPFDALRRENELTVRVYNTVWGDVHTPDEVTAWLPQIPNIRPFHGDDLRDTVGYGETMYVPLHEGPVDSGAAPPAADLAQFRKVASAVAEAGLYAHIHAHYHARISSFLDVIESIDKDVRALRPYRWTIVHAEGVTAEDLGRMRRIGMMVSINNWPTVGYEDQHAALGEHIYAAPPLKLIRESGLVWGIGTDATVVAPINPFFGLYWLVTGKSLSGHVATHDTATREEALIAWTRSNAHFFFRENELGSIEPGKLADFVVLDKDYMTVPADAIRDIKPAMTIVGGKIVYTAR
ncbi:MAG: amidohydrolase [Alphaproteobacteria bacterium]|nr:amidohydrolase [Alphaproteobacteria bacterium]